MVASGVITGKYKYKGEEYMMLGIFEETEGTVEIRAGNDDVIVTVHDADQIMVAIQDIYAGKYA